MAMEKEFVDFLKPQGISTATLLILEREDITTHGIFKLLSANHLDGLLNKLRLGQHALLANIWKRDQPLVRSHSVESQGSTHSGSSIGVGALSGGQLGSLGNLSMSSPKGNSSTSSIFDDDVKKLAALYKVKNKESSSGKSLSSKHQRDPRYMTIILGAMIYDDVKRKGVRRRCIPEPNPRKVQMRKTSHLKDLYDKCNSLYFDSSCTHEELRLADHNGMMIEVEERFWTLEKYYEENHYSIGRHKLYVMQYTDDYMASEEQVFGNSDEGSSEDDDEKPPGDSNANSSTPYTKPVLQPCIECNKQFYTYIPGTHCELDDGGIMCHEEPMLSCPECEYSGLGLAMNPHLNTPSTSK